MIILFGIGILCGGLAFVIGAWRGHNIHWQTHHAARLVVPEPWFRSEVRVWSLILVVVLSVIFATIFAYLIKTHIGDLIGRFSWGVLLLTRWLASGYAAFLKSQKTEKLLNKGQEGVMEEHDKRLKESFSELQATLSSLNLDQEDKSGE